METKKTETLTENEIDGLNPLSITDKMLERTSESAFLLYKEERELYDKARKIVGQIGQGGLWRGNDATLLIIAKAIKRGVQQY